MNDRDRAELIDSYLNRLSTALGDVPGDVRRDLVEDMRGHIEDAWNASQEHNRATLMNILERLGEPESLAREQRERLGLIEPQPQMGTDWLAIAAMVLTVLFWPVGILLAWLSPRWSGWDKAAATSIPVVGLMLLFAATAVAAVSYSSTEVAVQAVQVVELPAEAGDAQPTIVKAPRPVTVEPRATQDFILALMGRILILFGLVGAPPAAAIYLALRRRPNPHRWALAIPGVVALLVAYTLASIAITLTA